METNRIDGNRLRPSDVVRIVNSTDYGTILCLDGIANRCAGQLYKGERTRITWTANEILLPTIAGSSLAGGVFCFANSPSYYAKSITKTTYF